PRKKNSGWRDRSLCRTREGLLRCVRRHCGEIDSEVLFNLEALADWHPDWDHTTRSQNLDVRLTDRAQDEEQADVPVSQGFEAEGARPLRGSGGKCAQS